jgi:hypothetical protein
MAAADNLAFRTISCLVDGYAYIDANIAFGSPYCRWLCLYCFQTRSLISPKLDGNVVLLLRRNRDRHGGLYSVRTQEEERIQGPRGVSYLPYLPTPSPLGSMGIHYK